MHKRNNRNSRKRSGATEQYFCISYGAEVYSLSFSEIFVVIFERLGIKVCNIRLNVIRITVTVIACSKQKQGKTKRRPWKFTDPLAARRTETRPSRPTFSPNSTASRFPLPLRDRLDEAFLRVFQHGSRIFRVSFGNRKPGIENSIVPLSSSSFPRIFQGFSLRCASSFQPAVASESALKSACARD